MLPPLAAARRDDDTKRDASEAIASAGKEGAAGANLAFARQIADSELYDMAIGQVVSRLQATNTDRFLFLEESIGFSPTAADFSLEIHSYADMPDVAKLRLALRAREAAEQGTARLMLAALGKMLSLNDPERADESTSQAVRDYLTLRLALDPKYNPLETSKLRLSYRYPKPPERPKLEADVRARLGVLARYLSDPRHGGPVQALVRYFRKTPRQAQDLLWQCGSLWLAFEILVAGDKDPKDTVEYLVDRVNREAKKRDDTTLERVAVLWPDKEIKGADELTLPIKPVGPKQPEPPAAAMKAEERAAEFAKFNKEAGSMKPAEVKKRASYPHGIYYGIEVRGEDLPTPAAMRYEPNKSDPAKGKLVVTFKNKRVRSLVNVNPEEARAAWETLYGKDALADGEGTPILGLEQAGGSYHEITKKNVRRGRRSDVIVHPALLDTELAAAGIRGELLANNRAWLLAELDADGSLGEKESKDKKDSKDSRARTVIKQMVEWAFDPWRNLDVFYGGNHLSVFRLVDVPLVVTRGNEDDALRVMRDGDAYDELLRSKVFIEMLLHVQPTRDGAPRGDAVEVKKFAKETYPIMGDLLRASPELQRLNNFAAVLGVVRWAKAKGATFAEPAKPKGGPRTPESVAVFSDLVVPLARLKPEEVHKSEEKRLEGALTELRKTGGVKKYHKAWDGFFEAVKNEDEKGAKTTTEAVSKLENGDEDVKQFIRVVRALYYDRVDEMARKHRGKDGKTNQKKLRADFNDLVAKVRERVKKTPAEAALAIELLNDLSKRLFPKKDDA
jgi:hypothetical protein